MKDNGGGQPSRLSGIIQDLLSLTPSAQNQVDEKMEQYFVRQPYVLIIEEPDPVKLRFRYPSEGRPFGSIPGASSTPDHPTYPTIKVFDYVGPATIYVSYVTENKPYRPHPHNIGSYENGFCQVDTEITEQNNEFQFRNLDVQCVTRRQVDHSLRVREEFGVDPFNTGFAHRRSPKSIDPFAVRLAFQVFIPDTAGRMRPLPAVVSNVIYDKKTISDLVIVRASHCSGSAHGGTQVILLCKKASKAKTAVVFYEEDSNGQVIWEAAAIVLLVHQLAAIVFETPPYRNRNITQPVEVRYHLKQLSNNATSRSLPFEYIPECQVPSYLLARKRKTLDPLLTRELPQKVEKKLSPSIHTETPMPVYPQRQQNPTNHEILQPMPGPSHARDVVLDPNPYEEDFLGSPWLPCTTEIQYEDITSPDASLQNQNPTNHEVLQPMPCPSHAPDVVLDPTPYEQDYLGSPWLTCTKNIQYEDIASPDASLQNQVYIPVGDLVSISEPTYLISTVTQASEVPESSSYQTFDSQEVESLDASLSAELAQLDISTSENFEFIGQFINLPDNEDLL